MTENSCNHAKFWHLFDEFCTKAQQNAICHLGLGYLKIGKRQSSVPNVLQQIVAVGG